MNKIKSSENVFPCYPFLAGKKWEVKTNRYLYIFAAGEKK